ncbi:MAG: NADH-quinone oxidoreductase subunit N [Gemmatimonadota bacterium]|nr:NADH-quinone oxidoreductase subunit N [Gemmatimonadota bacterium]
MALDLLIPTQLSHALLPDLVLMAGAMVLMLMAAWRRDSAAHQRTVGIGAMVLIVVAIAAVLHMALGGYTAGGDGPIAVDGFRWALDLIILLGALATVALSIEQNVRDEITAAETHVLVLFAAAGMMILAAGRDLMVIFLGIEIMSVAVYVLAGIDRRRARAAEASLKYFLLGAFATGFLLYGIALIYGATGSTQIVDIGGRIVHFKLYTNPMLLVGTGLLLVGLGFKVAAAPFHMWAPDVYDGSPTPVTAFMAGSVKAAAFATFLRIWYEGLYFLTASWILPISALAVLTMFVGNVVALSQRNIKRMLAYSSIVHTGYLLVAIAASTAMGSTAMIFYLFAYGLATFGAFAIVMTLQPGGDEPALIADYEGLWHTRPWLAVAMAVYLLALLGFPVFGGIGFFAKWYLLQAALGAITAIVPLAVAVVLTSVISAGYYLQVVRAMFMSPRPEGAREVPAMGTMTRTVVAVTAVLILALGLFPSQLVRFSSENGLVPHAYSPTTGMGLPPGLRP